MYGNRIYPVMIYLVIRYGYLLSSQEISTALLVGVYINTFAHRIIAVPLRRIVLMENVISTLFSQRSGSLTSHTKDET